MEEKSLYFEDYRIYPSLKIGEGAFGQVFKGEHMKTGQKLAVKVMKNNSQTTPLKTIKAQIDILQKVRSPHIVKFFDIRRTAQNYYYIILEFCQSSLGSQIKKRSQNEPKNYFSEEQILKILREICEGYKILYQNKIIHRDIKPDNILIKNENYKIADFGFGKFVTNLDQQTKKTKLGTPIYSSPQILNDKHYSSKCDIWSLGVSLYQIMYLKKPFEINNSIELKRAVDKQDINFPSKPIYSKYGLQNLVMRMLKVQQKERIDWLQLFNHKLFKTDKQKDNSFNINIQKHFNFWNQIVDYVNFIEVQDFQLHTDIGLIKKICLKSYNLYLCNMVMDFLFLPLCHFDQITQNDWNTFKEKDRYWQLMQIVKNNIDEALMNINHVQSCLRNVDKTIANQIDEIIAKKPFNRQNYIKVMNWLIGKISQHNTLSKQTGDDESSIRNRDILIKQLEIIKSDPNEGQNQNIDYVELKKRVEKEIAEQIQ